MKIKNLLEASKEIRQTICIELHSKGFTALAHYIDRDTCKYLDYAKRINRIIDSENDKCFLSK